jgi:imidazoleglycerol-phosphate dehydratase
MEGEMPVTRTAQGIERVTKETKVLVEIDLDGTGQVDVSTGVGFYDHMLNQLAKHGGFDLTVRTEGDLEIDAHHTIEDTAIALGAAFARGARRQGRHPAVRRRTVPLDEVLAQAAVDLSGRPYVVHDEPEHRADDRRLRHHMTRHIFESFVAQAQVCPARLHVPVRRPQRAPHRGGQFKAFARALRDASRSTRAMSSSAHNMTKVVVLDYGFGQLRSAERAVAHRRGRRRSPRLSDKAMAADGLVVPGVGAFAACMGASRSSATGPWIAGGSGGRPVMGICVGMQILFDSGVEHGVETEGLAEWPGTVDRCAPPSSRTWAGTRSARPGTRGSSRDWTRTSATTSCTPTPSAPGSWTSATRTSRPRGSPGPRTASRSWPPWRTARCAPPSSTPRSPATPGPVCCATGSTRSDRPAPPAPARPDRTVRFPHANAPPRTPPRRRRP